MGTPIEFEGVNQIFGPPPGLEEMVGTLPVFMNAATVVSAWQLDSEEIEEIVKTGKVFLSVMSFGKVFPCYVGSEASVKLVASDTGKTW